MTHSEVFKGNLKQHLNHSMAYLASVNVSVQPGIVNRPQQKKFKGTAAVGQSKRPDSTT